VPYIGQQVLPFDPTRTQAPPRDADRFSGDGSAVTFTLSRSVQLETDIEVFVANVQQEPITAYSIVPGGTSLTFTAAPASGTNNIYVVYKNFNSGVQVTVPDGSITYAKLANNIRLFTTDNLVPDGSTTVFTLSETPAGANTLIVSIDGIVQRAPVHYTVSSNQITFTSAPQSSSNVHVRHLGFRTSATVTALAASSTISTPTIQSPTFTGVSGFPDGSASAPSIFRAGDTNTGVFFPAADTVSTTTGGTERLRIDSSGNVGIGTTSPSTRLHTLTASGENKLIVEASAASQAATLSLQTNNTTPGQCIVYMGKTGASTNGQVGYDPNSDYLYFFTVNTERMRISSSGNVGIGTSSPSVKFEINKGSAGSLATFTDGVTTNFNFSTSGLVGTFGTDAGGNSLALKSAGTERMRIDSSGNVGIGVTSYSEKLSLNGNVRFQTNSKTRIEYLNSTGAYSLGITGGAAVVFEYSAGNHEIAFETHWTGNSHVEHMRITKEGNLKFNSGYGSAATAFGCRAWVNFNGTGAVAIRASGNVSSITDNGTGSYTVNFTTAMPDANYCIQTPNIHEPGIAVWDIPIRLGTRTTTSCVVQCMNTVTTVTGDTSEIDVAIFR